MYNDVLANDGRECKKQQTYRVHVSSLLTLCNVYFFLMNTRYTITPGLRLFKKRQGEEVFRRVPFVCI